MNQRVNRLTAVLIDAILNNRAMQSPGAIARVLAENKVPLDVALRVITRPWERRCKKTVRTSA